jgi:hypothetical protein
MKKSKNKTKKVVINTRYGGFSLSALALKRISELQNKECDSFDYDSGIKNREDLLLIQVIEELKEKANGRWAELKIVKIPDDVEYTIEEYDGLEWIAEKHRTWS